MAITLEWIKEKIKGNAYYLSKHADQERQDDRLDIREVEDSILDGRILEQYEDAGRGESCLVCGFAQGKPIHAVCGRRGDWLVIITVYVPAPPRFKSPYERA